jgi:SAM-dependent methyltransferase
LKPDGPNAEQIRYWNEQAGPTWVEQCEMLDAMLEALGCEAMDRAPVTRGASVLDVGCGTGASALQLSERVGPSGSVTGLDISEPMLALARRRVRDARAGNVRFEVADAQTHPLPESFDLIFSRFGVMFFIDPEAAFANLLRGLRPGGWLVFLCWQEVGRNPWMLEPLRAVAQHVPLPPPPEPNAPGPFAFADAGRVAGILERAGFSDARLEPLERPLELGRGSIERAVEFVMSVGPTASLLRSAPDAAPAAIGAIRAALEPHMTPEGVRMSSAAWLATARRA